MIKKDVYLRDVFLGTPRLINLLNRLPGSKSYGSFHRSYWHHRMCDFPSAVNQMGVHALALLYHLKLEENPYFKNKKIKEWALAGFKYALSLQKNDGSFDEWYPNERGWAGPTGYIIHALYESYQLLKDDMSDELKKVFIEKAIKSGLFLIKYEEKDVLANHHAIALLPIYEVYLLSDDERILQGYRRCFEEFEKYWCSSEGWFLEYDGVDIGYLAGTISFLARLHRLTGENKIMQMVESALPFVSFHCYPDYSFGGTMGSRQTNHFYPFGFEYWSNYFLLAKKIANWGREGLEQRKHVSLLDQEDHYLFYRFPEYIEAYLSGNEKESSSSALLPYEEGDFHKFFEQAGIFIKKEGSYYTCVNLKKGGVVKCFSINEKKAVLLDSGWFGLDGHSRLISSQWNDPLYQVEFSKDKLEVRGQAHFIHDKVFTPWTWIAFRLVMLTFGWHSELARILKSVIRKTLMTGSSRSQIFFRRVIEIKKTGVDVYNEIDNQDKKFLQTVFSGGEEAMRYVPQSKYFLPQYLSFNSCKINLNDQKQESMIEFSNNVRFD